MKQKLYTHSMGSWTRYTAQLQPMIEELRKHLPDLRKAGALPFLDKMNWELDPLFDYSPQQQQSAAAAVEGAACTSAPSTIEDDDEDDL